MDVLKQVKAIREAVDTYKAQGLTVGFVPTMGFLHQGHQSLIQRAASENDRVVVSIFVNPMQFGPDEDYERYPKDLQGDIKRCEAAGAHILFHPLVSELYPQRLATTVTVAGFSNGLCGASRPGHFDGVCTVVAKLFHIVAPHKAYFGEKDAQQLVVIRRMVEDLNFDIDIVGCPIIREADGLAMSSRNAYLNAGERKAALCLVHALKKGQGHLAAGEQNPNVLRETMAQVIKSEPQARVDYIEVVDALTLMPVTKVNRPILVAIAVFIGKTRLIDNFSFYQY